MLVDFHFQDNFLIIYSKAVTILDILDIRRLDIGVITEILKFFVVVNNYFYD